MVRSDIETAIARIRQSRKRIHSSERENESACPITHVLRAQLDRGITKTEDEIVISRSCKLIKKSTQYRVTRDSSLQRTRKMRSADETPRARVKLSPVPVSGRLRIAGCLPISKTASLIFTRTAERAAREKRAVSRSAARSARLGFDPRARKQLTSQRADPRIPPLDSRRYVSPPSSPGYRLRAPKIGPLHIRFYFRGGRCIPRRYS